MKKWILFLSLLVVLGGCGFRNNNYPGWEYVRIEKQKPSEDCVYKIQLSCSGAGANCYNYYKQKATTYGANIVVITDMVSGQRSSGSAAVYNNIGGGGFKSEEAFTSLADLYNCPDCKAGEKK
jgi:hypothetical protein